MVIGLCGEETSWVLLVMLFKLRFCKLKRGGNAGAVLFHLSQPGDKCLNLPLVQGHLLESGRTVSGQRSEAQLLGLVVAGILPVGHLAHEVPCLLCILQQGAPLLSLAQLLPPFQALALECLDGDLHSTEAEGITAVAPVLLRKGPIDLVQQLLQLLHGVG